MGYNRRDFLKLATKTTVAATAVAATSTAHASSDKKVAAEDAVGCLIDTTICIGCRKCEDACNRSNNLPKPEKPFDDPSVLNTRRRPDEKKFTIINQYEGHPSKDKPHKAHTFVKFQCMHCIDPACVSACIVGALTKTDKGPVVYDADKCIGCRYCMVACPFQIPAYEYYNPLTPRVMKCTYCTDKITHENPNPACAAACPVEAIVFGKRKDLVKLAHEKIKHRPDRYENHVYGEYEVGGTSWMYLTGKPAEKIDLLKLPTAAPPRLTEKIQHGIFNYGILPAAFYGSLAGLMWFNRRKKKLNEQNHDDSTDNNSNKSNKGE